MNDNKDKPVGFIPMNKLHFDATPPKDFVSQEIPWVRLPCVPPRSRPFQQEYLQGPLPPAKEPKMHETLKPWSMTLMGAPVIRVPDKAQLPDGRTVYMPAVELFDRTVSPHELSDADFFITRFPNAPEPSICYVITAGRHARYKTTFVVLRGPDPSNGDRFEKLTGDWGTMTIRMLPIADIKNGRPREVEETEERPQWIPTGEKLPDGRPLYRPGSQDFVLGDVFIGDISKNHEAGTDPSEEETK